MVQLLDVARRERFGEVIIDHAGIEEVSGLAFSPDGRFLISAGRYGTLVTDLDPDAWETRLFRTVSRNVPQLEWTQYFGTKVPYHRTCANLPDGAAEKLVLATKP
jgi:hypothetical protein